MKREKQTDRWDGLRGPCWSFLFYVLLLGKKNTSMFLSSTVVSHWRDCHMFFCSKWQECVDANGTSRIKNEHKDRFTLYLRTQIRTLCHSAAMTLPLLSSDVGCSHQVSTVPKFYSFCSHRKVWLVGGTCHDITIYCTVFMQFGVENPQAEQHIEDSPHVGSICINIGT